MKKHLVMVALVVFVGVTLAADGRPVVVADHSRLLRVAVLSGSPNGAPQSVGSNAEATRLLSEVKAVTGGARWDRITTWHERGTFRTGDLTGSYDSWVDFRHFRSYTEVRPTSTVLGTIRKLSGWTGKVSWSADQTGDVRVDDSEASRSDAIGSVYFATFGYLFGTRYPAKIQTLPPQMSDDTQFDVVQVTPRDSDPLELWIDRASHRVLRSAPVTGIDKHATVFSDFRKVGGITVPFKSVEAGEASDPRQESQITLIEFNHAAPRGIFAAPLSRFTDVYFPTSQDSVTVDFRLINNQIHLPVTLNGQRFEDFLFDTGAPNSVETSKARTLGLKVEVAGKEYGGGTDSEVVGLTKVDCLDLGGLRFDQQIFQTDESSAHGEGTIGYEIAKRTVVVVDYARNRITFMKPAVFRPPPQAVALPFRFAGNLVLIEATVDGDRGEFIVDTGSAGSLLLLHPFAEQHRLVEKHHAVHEAEARGVGGSAPILLFRPDQFSIGSLHPPTPTGGIFLSQSGVGAMEHIAGNIGNGILKRFTMTLDYAHHLLYLEPNAHFPEPDVYFVGWSGLKVSKNVTSDHPEVVEVETGSPAAQAGVRAGDVIIAINGSSLETLDAEQINDALSAPPGTVLRLTIRRRNDTREVSLTTKPLI
jgi:membrane-associated protease RseP (regulator of RpoE activity)